MAREHHTAEQLEEIAEQLVSAAKDVVGIAEQLKASGMPHSLIHGTTLRSVYIPQLLDWIGKAKVDTESQIRSYRAGVQSKAEVHKKKNENQKQKAAKNTAKKKA